jgi:hypothetical protein
MPLVLMPVDGGPPVAAIAWAEETLVAGVGPAVLSIDPRSPAHPTPLITADDDVAAVAVSADSRTLAVADDAGAATLARLPGGAVVAALRAHAPMASAAAWLPSRAERLVTGGMDATVALWDSGARRCVRRWAAGAGVAGDDASEGRLFNPPFVHALAVMPAGTPRPAAGLAAAACGDGAVLLIDAESAPAGTAGTAPSPLLALGLAQGGHTAAAAAAAFVGPRLLATGGDDGRVLLWDWGAALAAGDAVRLPPAWRAVAASVPAGPPARVADVGHGRKVQALAAGPGGALAVCDVTSMVTLCALG